MRVQRCRRFAAEHGIQMAGFRRQCGAGRRAQGQAQPEQRTARCSRAGFDAAAVQLGEFLDDGQPETGAAVAPLRSALDLAEALENNLAHGFRNAGAAVAEGERGVFAVALQREFDAAAVGGELERVGEQVEQDALDLLAVYLCRHRVWQIEFERDVAILRQRFELAGPVAYQTREIGPRVAHRHPAGFQLGGVEQVGDMAVEQVRVAQHHLGLASLGSELTAREAPGQRGHDQGQRRAQLVADVGEELALQLVQLQGLLVQGADLFVCCARFLQGGIGVLQGQREAPEEPGKQSAHDGEQHDGGTGRRIFQHEGESRRDVNVPDQQRAQQGAGEAAAQPANPGADEGGGEEQEPDIGLDEGVPQQPLQQAGENGYQQGEGDFHVRSP